jgi:hypothetical protein
MSAALQGYRWEKPIGRNRWLGLKAFVLMSVAAGTLLWPQVLRDVSSPQCCAMAAEAAYSGLQFKAKEGPEKTLRGSAKPSGVSRSERLDGRGAGKMRPGDRKMHELKPRPYRFSFSATLSAQG